MDGFELRNGVLDTGEGSVFGVDPLRIIRVFLHAQNHNAVFAPSLKVRLRRRAYLIDRPYIYRQAIREILLTLLSKKGKVGRILRMMHELGILGRLFPEFRPLTCLVQHEFFHQYTADEHTLVCIEVIDRIVDSQDLPFAKYKPLLQSITRPHLLYLAMLLHDTGKSDNSKHHSQASATLAVKAARRLKLTPGDISVLVFLVDHHLTMSEIARRQNLEDEKIIVDFARVVQTQERLDMLMLLTFADVLGTGATRNYSDWKDLLLWQLYRRTSAALSGAQEFIEAANRMRTEIQQGIITQLSEEFDRGEVEAHFANLPASYLHTVPEELIRHHIRLVHEFLNTQATQDDMFLRPTISWRDFPEKGYSEVTVVTWDRDRLFARVTGSFAASNLTILKADVFTREDDIAIETLFVATELLEAATDPRDRKQFEKFLFQAMHGSTFDFSPVLIKKRKPRLTVSVLPHHDQTLVPVRVTVDQYNSATHTLIDVQTADYPGLLHRIAGVLADFGLDISTARISTEKGAALDTFYVTTAEGKKLTDTDTLKCLMDRLRTEITA
jgi:[protein-PII] uridylyltransferase